PSPPALLSVPPPPPRSTPFPYTTLFRSGRIDRRQHLAQLRRQATPSVPLLRSRLHGNDRPRPGSRGNPRPAPDGCSRLVRVADRDRKSTRLNSSHLGISYAVFCLKKKNK